MAPPTRQFLDDPVCQDQKFQRQVVHIQSFVIELHHAPSVTRLAGCLSDRRLRGQLPAARACLARAKTQAYQPKLPPMVSYGPSGTGTGTGTFTARPAIQGHALVGGAAFGLAAAAAAGFATATPSRAATPSGTAIPSGAPAASRIVAAGAAASA